MTETSSSPRPQPGETCGALRIESRQYLAGGRLLRCRCACGQGVRVWTRDWGTRTACASCEAGQLALPLELDRVA